MDNRDYARVLAEISTLQRVAGDQFFKVRAFERAARIVEGLAEPLDGLIDARRLDTIAGIGESIEEELQELRTTGQSSRHQELLSRVGPDVLQLWEIPGLGTKRIQVLFQKLGVASIPALKAAAEQGRLAMLDTFGAAVQAKLLDEIAGWERGRGRRYPLPEALALAESVLVEIADLPEVERAAIGGSIRRGKETIGDIDILVTTEFAAQVSGYFKELPDVTEVIFDGDTRASVRITKEVQCDLRVVEPHLFGAGLHYFTGSKDHHIQMRLRSKRMGLKISEKGVTRYDDPTDTPVTAMDTEEEVFAAVGLPYIPPELRMGKDEIQAAEAGKLPDLVTLASLAGDTRVYTNASGGRLSLDEAAERALALGYRWLVISERSRGVAGDVGLSDAQFLERFAAIRELDARLDGLRVLAGVHAEILPDGMIDVGPRVLSEADWVNAGVHHDLEMSAEEMTQRVVWGLETGLVSCLVNPTGRILGGAQGYRIYLDEVIEVANDFGVALEMTGDPRRLDLNGREARRARDLGARIVVSSASGSSRAMTDIRFAVQQARRAWFEERDIMNVMHAEALLQGTRTLVR